MVVQKDAVRSEIVAVAGKIFTRFGFRKTTMEDIARALGKGKSSIYYYFPGKEDIFRAVVENEAAELKKDLNKTILKVSDPIEQLRTFILFRTHKLKTLSNFYAALNEEYFNHLDFIQKIRMEYDNSEIALVGKILRTGINNGEFMIDDPELAAVAIVTAMKGLEIPLFIKKEHGKIEDRLDSLIKFLFYGLIRRECKS